MKIVVLDGYAFNPGDLSWDTLKQFGDLTVYDRTLPADVISRIGDAEIIYVNKVHITKEVMDACPSIKFIGVLATGYNVVDIAAARAHGIDVTNVPAYSTTSVAQLTIALLLEACHHVGEHSRGVHDGVWCRSIDFSYWNDPLIELKDKTLGIIGYGSIGKNVSQIAQALGMNILYNARSPKPELENKQVHFASLDEIYRNADVISLHCPLFPETTNLINKDSISKMKDGVILINTARGPIINEQDVANGLNCGKIGYAALDVLSTEPMEENNPLLGVKNCIITPHFGWAPKEARIRLMDITVENLKAYLESRSINVVNK